MSPEIVSNSLKSKSVSPTRDQDNILTNDVLSDSRIHPSNPANLTTTNFKDGVHMFVDG